MSIPIPLSGHTVVPRSLMPVQTSFGVLSGPGTRAAAYVRSTGVQDGDDEFIRNNLVTTLNAGLARARSGLGDYVYVLPGHDEDLAGADALSSLVAGTNIVGIGHGTLRPKLTWTTAATTVLFDVANTTLANFQLEMSGDASGSALTVAAPLTVSAAGCGIYGCRINMGDDANEKVTIGITTTAAADDFVMAGNLIHSATAAEATTLCRFVGADRLVFHDNIVTGATSSTTVGVVQFLTTASTQIDINNCVFQNNKASSVHALTGMSGLTGFVRNSLFGILDNATLAGFVTPGSTQGHNNRTANLAGEQGGITTTVSA